MFKDKVYDKRQILDHAFSVINESDFLFVLQTSDNKSEGMLMEVGYCFAKGIPILACVKDSVKSSYIPELTPFKMSWSNPDDLIQAIRNFDFATMGSQT